ncbi:hypothetical protein [Rufibacter ruber]|uniref:5'-methylthioadenosine/S-adenosylhomocysteine nucleosidase family protein n=1 Tax=Rufibacter ruber TaxID=1783499 RepID=UPI000830D20B|nr:hypothetical protein [Rufibacter ruber]
MIRILIADDTQDKIDSIINFIESVAPLHLLTIDIAKSIVSARRFLSYHDYDLLILDLVLPLEDNGEALPNNSTGFLEQISDSPLLNPPSYIVGLTAYNDLKAEYEKYFHNENTHLIEYSPQSTEWQSKLKKFIFNIARSNKLLTNPSFHYDIAIVTALAKPELEAVLNELDEWEPIRMPNDTTLYHTATIINEHGTFKVVAASPDDMGMVPMAVFCTKLIQHFRPKTIFMAGIAAGVRGENNIGDILVASQLFDGAAGKVSTADNNMPLFKPDPHYLVLEPSLRTLFSQFKTKTADLFTIMNNYKGLKPQTLLNIHIDSMVTVSSVIQFAPTIEDYKSRQRKLIGLEMEGYGLFYACSNSLQPRPFAILIKSVCDFGDSFKESSYQPYASYTSASFLFHFINTSLIPSGFLSSM